MGRFFNIAGPCNAEDHYMLSATERVPDVMRLVEDKTYFVVHAQRQCGKTTAFRTLADDINAKGERLAMYCSLEVVQEFPDPTDGIPMIYEMIRGEAQYRPELKACPFLIEGHRRFDRETLASKGISELLSELSVYAGKPFVVFFDEVDCLSGATLVTFLRQLRNGCISRRKGIDFPASIALIGMRNIRDFKAKVRPDRETLGSASPFNVITEAMTLRTFTAEEVAELYRQHTDATGQVFEPGVAALAYEYSRGQPYLVNALARWCMDKIHDRRFGEPITLADMHEAKERIIRERGTHLDSLMERMKEPRVRPVVEAVMTGSEILENVLDDDLSFVLDLGLLVSERGVLSPANPMYAEIMGRYLSWGTQQFVLRNVPETPWVKDGGLDMAGLMAAFQEFWRENADEAAVPFHYREAYPQLVLQAFLQRVINGGGEIIREMALGKKAMDLGVLFRGAKYAVECKKVSFYEKSHEKAYDQVCGYMDRLGVGEGWLVVFDHDLAKPWEGKIYSRDVSWQGKTVHLVGC